MIAASATPSITNIDTTVRACHFLSRAQVSSGTTIGTGSMLSLLTLIGGGTSSVILTYEASEYLYRTPIGLSTDGALECASGLKSLDATR